MSSDRQRLVGAIRRIAGIDADDSDRASSSANRGSQPGSVGRGITESDERLCCDGSVTDSLNPGTTTSDPGSGGSDGLDSSDPSDLGDIGAGDLTGVTDCETGDPVCFSGAGFVPPDNWDSPSSPPRYEVVSEEPSCSSPSGFYNGRAYQLFQRCSAGSPYDTNKWEGVDNCIQMDDCEGFFPALARTIEVYEEPPVIEGAKWPSDGCVNLSIAGGKIVGSKYDPENDGSYNAPRNEIELCDGSNGSILIRGSAGGGWKSIASLNGDIDPDTNHGYLYSAYGDVIRQISPNEFRDDRV